MKGILKFDHGIEGTQLRHDLPEPKAGFGQVKIKVHAATICGTDVHVLYSNEMMSRYKMPVIIGHEGSGEIVEVGEGVKNYSVGDRVVVETTFDSCMQCEFCYEAKFNCCNQRVGLGSGADGYFGEYMVAIERSVHKIPDHLSYEAAAMMEPLACTTHAVMNQSTVEAGDVAVIFGPGPIGLLAAQVARANGCVTVICGITADEKRLKFAKEVLKFEHVLDTQVDDLNSYINNLTNYRGSDVVYECSGVRPAISSAFEILKKRGQFVALGIAKGNVEIPYGTLLYDKELVLAGVRSSTPSSWNKALRLLDYKMINVEDMISHVFPIEDWRKGYELSKSGEAIKVVLKP